MGIVKIGNTSFQAEAIKKMSLKSFKDTYDGILGEDNTENAYKTITGRETVEKKKKIEDSNVG